MRLRDLRFQAPACREGFTLTDLLFVVVTLGLLALLVLPAFAGVQNKGGRADCANNLRQIGQDTMIYAGENNNWLPICTLGAANGDGMKTNFLGAEHYTRYVYLNDAAPNTHITTNEPPVAFGEGYQNLGYLYQAGLAGNGSIFYCPANWGGFLGANAYLPLLTSDSVGAVRSSYLYNPRVVNPNTGPWPRRYQKTSDLPPHKLFAMDYILTTTTSGVDPVGNATGVNPSSIEHIRDRGWNVLFTDGSVQFSRITVDNNVPFYLIINNFSEGENSQSFEGYDQIFNWLEQDH